MKRFLAVVLVLLVAGCMQPKPIASSSGATVTALRSVSTLEARFLLTMAGVGGLPAAHSVDCYRVEYTVPGDARKLSGLLAVPRGVAPKGLVMFAHGTTTTRTAVPSTPDTGGLAAAIVFAGNGYALVAPDYPGLGVSEGKHPYYIADSIIPSIVAMIDAVRPLDGIGDAPVFLTGFSQGGWATMQTLRALEARGDTVLAAAPVAGAFNLRNLSLPVAMEGDAASHSLYLAYAAWGQAAYLGHRLDSALTPEMAATVDRLFAGASPQEIRKGLPASPRDMFNRDFLDAFDKGGAHWMLEAFADNSVEDFRPRAPVRLYYGAEDQDVSPEESRALAQRLKGQGADAVAIDVGPVGHDPSMLKAAPLILQWLKELETGAGNT